MTHWIHETTDQIAMALVGSGESMHTPKSLHCVVQFNGGL